MTGWEEEGRAGRRKDISSLNSYGPVSTMYPGHVIMVRLERLRSGGRGPSRRVTVCGPVPVISDHVGLLRFALDP